MTENPTHSNPALTPEAQLIIDRVEIMTLAEINQLEREQANLNSRHDSYGSDYITGRAKMNSTADYHPVRKAVTTALAESGFLGTTNIRSAITWAALAMQCHELLTIGEFSALTAAWRATTGMRASRPAPTPREVRPQPEQKAVATNPAFTGGDWSAAQKVAEMTAVAVFNHTLAANPSGAIGTAARTEEAVKAVGRTFAALLPASAARPVAPVASTPPATLDTTFMAEFLHRYDQANSAEPRTIGYHHDAVRALQYALDATNPLFRE